MFSDPWSLCSFMFSTIPGNPVTQGARTDPEVPGHLGDRNTGIPDNPHGPLGNPGRTSRVSLTCSCPAAHSSFRDSTRPFPSNRACGSPAHGTLSGFLAITRTGPSPAGDD